MITASDVLTIIHKMGRDDISIDTQNLITDGILSSLHRSSIVRM